MMIKKSKILSLGTATVLALMVGCASTNPLTEMPVEKRSTLLVQSAEGGYKDRVSALIDAGADVNYVTADGSTALSRAAMEGRLPIVKMLIRAGADVNQSHDGQSLLMHIVNNGDLLMAQVLIAAGADVNFVAEDGRSALTIAVEKRLRDIEMLLRQSGAQS